MVSIASTIECRRQHGQYLRIAAIILVILILGDIAIDPRVRFGDVDCNGSIIAAIAAVSVAETEGDDVQ